MVKKKELNVDFDLSDASVNVPQAPTEIKIIPPIENTIDTNKDKTEITKRLTVNIPLSLHKKFKLLAMEQDTTMTNLLRNWIKEHT